MNLPRMYALAVGIALVAAEIVKPTTIPHKGVSHPSLVRAVGAALPLTWEQLDDLPPVIQPAIGNIDAVSAIVGGKAGPTTPNLHLRLKDSFVVGGWCADAAALEPGAGLIAIVDEARRIDVSAGYGKRRDDVARLYAKPAMALVGFDFTLTARQIGPGTHTLRVGVVASDGHGIFIYPTIAHITISP